MSSCIILHKFEFCPNKGFDFSGNENLDYIRSALESVGVTHHIWQGDGITNCLPRGTRRLWEALRRRDLPSYKYIEKVYWWTVDRMSTMKRTLRMGVDGIITNHPHRLIRVLEDDEFSSKLRLATIDDSPWQKYSLRSSADISDVRPANNGNYSTEVEGEELLYNS
ncbi:dermonecrotic toxin SpeSicTox-betaIIA2iii-like [Stegodyphus dumicola]|uniref:dermonecrotic toxin SpeSicTox-betaIIA2iii-like n=1 Tax=Stegodyphus dumicola TaxID=202533 RepID=UPI0015A8E2B7|nr:dermonecrotic toxin SpeSicTox-betaIIA2iii-like [Stegodyphus dumicola]